MKNIKISYIFLAFIIFNSESKAQNITTTLGIGFQLENILIGDPTDIFRTMIMNREIYHLMAVQLAIGKTIGDHFEVGGEFSYTWADLGYQIVYINSVPTISDIEWTSFGVWGKHSCLPDKKIQPTIRISSGVHVGYPKNITEITIEREVKFYVGAHAGVKYALSERFSILYYHGRGKYNNQLLIGYNF